MRFILVLAKKSDSGKLFAAIARALLLSIQHYEQSPFLMGKHTISEAMFNSYVSLAEGNIHGQ